MGLIGVMGVVGDGNTYRLGLRYSINNAQYSWKSTLVPFYKSTLVHFFLEGSVQTWLQMTRYIFNWFHALFWYKALEEKSVSSMASTHRTRESVRTKRSRLILLQRFTDKIFRSHETTTIDFSAALYSKNFPKSRESMRIELRELSTDWINSRTSSAFSRTSFFFHFLLQHKN